MSLEPILNPLRGRPSILKRTDHVPQRMSSLTFRLTQEGILLLAQVRRLIVPTAEQ